MITVTAHGKFFILTLGDDNDGKIYVLGEKALRWNLMNVFGCLRFITAECIACCAKGETYTIVLSEAA